MSSQHSNNKKEWANPAECTVKPHFLIVDNNLFFYFFTATYFWFLLLGLSGIVITILFESNNNLRCLFANPLSSANPK
jgi:hypothetical protein